MSIEEIIQLIQAVSENKLTSFELEEGNMKLSLKCKKEQPQIVTVAAASMDQAAVQMLNTAAAGAGVSVAQVQDQPAQTAGVDIGSDKVVTSPPGWNLLRFLLAGCRCIRKGGGHREKGPGAGNHRGHEADERDRKRI